MVTTNALEERTNKIKGFLKY